MNLDLDGTTALVLGSSKGIGHAIAAALAAEGARVAVVGRQLERAEAAAGRIGSMARGYACDTGRMDEIDALHAAVTADLGPIDILVLNSGGPPPLPAAGVSSEQWRASFETLFVGPVRLADLALPAMRDRGFGRILSVVSSGVIEPIPNLALSNAIRAALVGWGKTLAGEVGRHGVTVNALAPGRIETDRLQELDTANAARQGIEIDAVRAGAGARIPAGRYGQPEEFGAVAAFVASRKASFLTGSVLRIDGGQILSSH